MTLTTAAPPARGVAPLNPAVGVSSSLGASVLFSVVFFLATTLAPLDAQQMLAWRVVAMLAVVASFFTVFRMWPDVRGILARLRRQPALAGVVVLDGALFGVQQWLFGWAPQAGRGLEAALGYLLLPLVMVVLGVVLHRERLSALRAAAVGAATAGVVVAVFVAGGLAWPTLVVALGFPVYFAIRRHARLDSGGALFLELVAMLPFVMWMLSRHSTWALLADPGLVGSVALFGFVSGVAFMLFFRASQLLSFGMFGLLGYLEPILLVVVAVTFLDETLVVTDALVYGPITIALALLAAESVKRKPDFAMKPN